MAETEQIDSRTKDAPANTREQTQAIKEAEARWEDERTWPMWDVSIEGDEVDYVARPGVNEDEDGVPQPYRDTARAHVRCRAKSSDHAKALALAANPGYHTVTKATEIKED